MTLDEEAKMALTDPDQFIALNILRESMNVRATEVLREKYKANILKEENYYKMLERDEEFDRFVKSGLTYEDFNWKRNEK